VWDWNGAGAGNHLWSNSANWLFNGAPAAANTYPGMPFSFNDVVGFSNNLMGPATLDVALANSLQTLGFAGWNNTLTLNKDVTVSNTAAGGAAFGLTDASTISLAANVTLTLSHTPIAQASDVWRSGEIVGGANSKVHVVDAELDINGGSDLGTNLVVDQGTGQPTAGGYVAISGTTRNLNLTGTANYIDVGNGGVLELFQQITVAGQQNTEGGIAFDPGHTGTLAVQVEKGGLLWREATPTAGVTNQVSIAGSVYNLGGTVEVDGGSLLNITGKDANNVSYWQKTDGAGLLQVKQNGNINAAGNYQIDTGTVQLATGGTSIDRLDGAALIFGNANNTALTLVDQTNGTPGTATVQGPVTLAANTTVTMNFNGTAGTTDALNVQNGVLALNNSKLILKAAPDGVKLGAVSTLFNDMGTPADITGAFASIVDTLRNNYTTQTKVKVNNQFYYNQVGP
jgi:hypothetical protein